MGLDRWRLSANDKVSGRYDPTKNWIKVLKDDWRAIFTAAAHAQRAADYLHGLQPEGEALAA